MQNKIKAWCLDNRVRIKEQKSIPHGEQIKLEGSLGEKLSLSLFHTGKFLIQGKDSPLKSSLERFLGLPSSSSRKPTPSAPSHSPTLEHQSQAWLGVDESGKGDFFGPLVVSSVVVSRKLEEQLISLGVKDSKKLNDTRILEMAPQLEGKLKSHTEILMPEDYNKTYENYRNLNTLLASLHAKCMKAIYDDRIDLMISDKFAVRDEVLIQAVEKESLDPKKLLQVPRAEEDLAVACASILARYHFVKGIESLEKKFQISLPKGASETVFQQAVAFRNRYGIDKVSQVAKLHFKTFDRLRDHGTEE